MELSALKFAADTTELERASKVIADLVTDVSKLDKASRDAAQTEAILAKAAKSNADANLQNAKAQDVRLKSTIAADKADKASVESVAKKTKAVEKETEATAKNVGVLQKQKDILEFQTQGYSKGQAGILAYGKAAGLATSDIQELGKVLETQRKLMGGDPFDKSLSGIKSLQNQYTELKESLRQYNTDSELSAKQTRELARDKERLIEKMKVEGASFQDIRKAVRAHNQEYVNLAGQYNKLASAEDAVVKSRKEAVAATNYLTQADQKLAAALNTSNAAIDKAGTDSLVRYENALRKSGVSQDVATSRLSAYKAQLVQVQALEEKRRAQHLARALTPQISDVVVSLWSGQSPFTVLLQQGAQVNDLFQLSGVAAADFGKTVKQAFTSMLPAILTVVKGVGGLIVDGFMAAGNAVVNFAGKITGLNGVMDAGATKLRSMGFEGFAATVQYFGKVGAPAAAGGILVLVAALTSLGIAFKNALKEGAELSRNLELTGASLALTKSAAIDLAQSLATSERPVASVVSVINELAKAGKFSSENIALVTNAAIDLERYGKVAIADTAKELSKLREDPVKALIEVAEKTGYVNLETIETVKSLREQGRMAEAAERAMKAWATSSTSAATSIKNQMSPLEQVWDSMLSKINLVIGRLQDLARGSGLAEQIADKEAQLASVKGGFFTSTFGLSPKGAKDVDRLSEEIYMLKLQLQAETDITKERAKRSSAAAQFKAETEATKEYTAAIEKQAGKEATLSEFVKKAVEDRTRSVASALSKNVEDVKLSAEAIDKITKGAELQWKEMQKKPKKDPSENYYATLMREATNNTIAATNATEELTKSELKLLEVKADPRFASLNSNQKQDVANKYEAAIAAEKQAKAVEDVTKAEEFRLKILGKSEGITKDYYAQIKALEEHAVKAGWSREQIEELTRAIFQGTPAWQQYQKALEDVNRSADKFNEGSIASQAETAKDNQELDHRISLLGKTSEQQKLIAIEYQRANKLRDVDVKLARQLRDIEDDISRAKLKGLKPEDYRQLTDAQVQAEQEAAEQRKTINREVAVQYAEDLQREIDNIKNGISDSIVTALFEGGKAGSQRIRSVLMDALRKPVTMVVNAVVNTLMGNVLGSLLGGGGAMAGAAGAGGVGNLISMGMQGTQLYSGLTSGTGILGNIGGMLGLAPAVGTGVGAGVTAVNGLSALTPVSIATNSSAVAGVTAGSSSGLMGTLGTVAPYLLAIIALAASWKKLFGRTLKDSGIQGEFGGESGFEGQQYKFYKGGLFRSDKTELSPLDEAMRKTLADSFKAMKDQVIDFAKVLNLSTKGLDDFKSTFKLSLHGLSEQDANAKIQEALMTLNNELAQEILGTWTETQREVQRTYQRSSGGGAAEGGDMEWATATDTITERVYKASEYAKEGEKAIDTLTRLATSLSTVNAVFDTLGYTAYESSLKGGDMASKLADLFGGLDKLVESSTFYYQNFYTEAERSNTAMRQLEAEFKKNNITLPKTRDEFRKLVEAQDLTTEEGRKFYTLLLQLAPAFDVVADQVEATIAMVANTSRELSDRILEQQARYYDAVGKTTEAAAARQKLLEMQRWREYYSYMDAGHPELARLAIELWQLEDATTAAIQAQEELKKSMDGVFNALQEAVKIEKDALTERANLTKSTISTLKSLFDFLDKAVSDLYQQVTSTSGISYSNARASINQAFATVASGGSVADPAALQEAVNVSMQGLSSGNFATKQDYDRERLRLAAQLAVLRDSTKKSLTVEEEILAGIEDQIQVLDDTLEYWKKQISIANGTLIATMSITEAIARLTELMFPSKKPPTDSGGKPSGGAVWGGSSGSSSGAQPSKYQRVISAGTAGVGYENVIDKELIAKLDKLSPIYRSFDGTGDLVGLLNATKAAGGSLYDLHILSGFFESDWVKAANSVGIPAFEKGGAYRGGMALVGEKGPELINFRSPGQVYNANQTGDILSGNSTRIENLERSNAAIVTALNKIAENTKRTSDTLRNVSPAGNALSVESDSFLEL